LLGALWRSGIRDSRLLVIVEMLLLCPLVFSLTVSLLLDFLSTGIICGQQSRVEF
jgi:hypothetical protein